MSLLRLIACVCGHCVEDHDDAGCQKRAATLRCTCRLPRSGVVDALLDVEREEIRRQWTPEHARSA